MNGRVRRRRSVHAPEENRTRLMTCSSTHLSTTARPPSGSEGGEPPGRLIGSAGNGLVVVIGGGRFGERAARILSSDPNRSVWVVERDEGCGPALAKLPVRLLRRDGVAFLADTLPRLADEDLVVPAVPIHLAVEWLRRTLDSTANVRIVPVPEALRRVLPHTWIAGDGSLLISYADFLCPEDCPEPEDGCTVTGEVRTPLYDLFANLEAPGFDVHVIRSRQLAPGLGGYSVADLCGFRDRVLGRPGKRWLVGTACRCHGTLTGLEVTPRPE